VNPFLVMVVVGSAIPIFVPRRKESDASAVWNLVRELRHRPLHSEKGEGTRVRDVAGLYAQGLISRETAEADTHPLAPLVAQPGAYPGDSSWRWKRESPSTWKWLA
jgi:hypothetical protein